MVPEQHLRARCSYATRVTRATIQVVLVHFYRTCLKWVGSAKTVEFVAIAVRVNQDRGRHHDGTLALLFATHAINSAIRASPVRCEFPFALVY